MSSENKENETNVFQLLIVGTGEEAPTFSSIFGWDSAITGLHILPEGSLEEKKYQAI